ncbi:sensor histidine kinase [Geoglobus acetivorans]|uniref:histidine kinase n=1 Tax=Geoglobus acetivorans TaxID=565033 RepID=A0A0A7GF01_GEOAI|nr:signal-transducing histidine kinase [Geoglobus acetivorans]
MKLRFKAAFTITGLLIAFYIINFGITGHLIFNAKQAYFQDLLDDGERSLTEVLSEETMELKSYMEFFELAYNGNNTGKIKQIMLENYHLDGFIAVEENGTSITVITNGNIPAPLKFVQMVNNSGIDGTACGFEKLDTLYIVCADVNRAKGTAYILLDRIDENYFKELKDIFEIEVIGFVTKPDELQMKFARYIPVKSLNGETVGYITIGYEDRLEPVVLDALRKSIYVFIFLTAILSTVGYYLFDRDILGRIQRIRNYMVNIREHGFRAEKKLTDDGDDEISELLDSINLAIEEIEKNRNELQKALENLRVVNRVLRHDLLNDLTAIRGYAELGRDHCQFCDKMTCRIDKASRTIKTLGDVERIIKDSEFEKFRLKEVIEDVARNYHIDFEIKGDAEVIADAGIYSVLDNLISNSIKHGKSEKMSFEIKDEGEYIHVVVKDYGTGISETDIDKIFEEGFSLSGSTGIGLYIVRKLMEKYGGRVYAESSDRDGAVFHLYFQKPQG